MDSIIKLYLIRGEDEFLLATNDLKISIDEAIKQNLGILKEKTFYYSVISHSYYSIFYTAKAYLLSKGIKTYAPEEHRKTYEEFKNFVNSGLLNQELLTIYDDAMNKAEELLNIYFDEKKKRGRFNYNIRSEANLIYAKESINGAKKFLSAIKNILETLWKNIFSSQFYLSL